MKVLGITGGVGSGKSTVLAYLEERYKAAVLQCDLIGRQLQEKGTPLFEQILTLFRSEGKAEGILLPDGSLDRRAAAAAVFADRALLERLNSLVHPAVKAEVIRRLRLCRDEGNYPFAAVEAALLLEDHYDQICDEIWYIRASRETRERRLALSRGYTPEKSASIMNAQHSDDWFAKRCDLVIDNSGDTPEACCRQIDEGLRTHGFLYDSQRQQR